MAVNLEVESRELIDLVGVEFNAIQRLFSDKKFSAAAKGIASMMSRLLKLRTVNETLVISMIHDLDTFKKEIETNVKMHFRKRGFNVQFLVSSDGEKYFNVSW